MWRLIIFWEDLISKIHKIINHIVNNLFAYILLLLLAFLICQRNEISKLKSEYKTEITTNFLKLQRTFDSVGVASLEQIKKIAGNQMELINLLNENYKKLTFLERLTKKLLETQPQLLIKVDTVVVETLQSRMLIYYLKYSDQYIFWEAVNPKDQTIGKGSQKIGEAESFEIWTAKENLFIKVGKKRIKFYWDASLGLYFSPTKELELLTSCGLKLNKNQLGLVFNPFAQKLGILYKLNLK